MLEEKKKYKVLVKGSDVFGLNFLDSVVALANKGAYIDKDHPVSNKWPHSCIMSIETDKDIYEVVVGDILKGVEVLGIPPVPSEPYLTEEEIKELPWDDFREKARSHFNITGRVRNTLEQEYLDKVKMVEETINGGLCG